MIVSLIAVLGFQTSVIKYSAEYKDDNSAINSLVSTSILIAFPFSIFLTALLIVIPLFIHDIYFNEEVTVVTQYIMLGLPFFSLNRIYAALLNGKRDMRIYAINQSFRWISITIFIILGVFCNLDIKYTILSFVITEILLLIWMFFYTKKYFSLRFELNREWIRKHIVFGLKTLLLGILNETNNRTDIFLIGFFLSSYYIGIYSFASTIVRGVLMVTSIVQLNINPIISSLWSKGDIEQIRNYTRKVIKGTAFIVLPIIIAAALLYPPYIYIFMKEPSYIQSLPVFYILLLGIILPAIYNFSGGYFAMANFLNTSLLTMIQRIIFNVISAIICINIFGFWGAAISTSLTYILSMVLLYYYLKKKMDIDLLSFR